MQSVLLGGVMVQAEGVTLNTLFEYLVEVTLKRFRSDVPGFPILVRAIQD